MHIVHIQSLLWVDDSILAGVSLTSSFCLVPESSYSSNTVISSLLVAWSLNCSIAASSTNSMVASFKNFCTKGGGRRMVVVQLSFISCGLLLGSPKNSLQTPSPQNSHTWSTQDTITATVSIYLQSKSVWHHSIGIYGIYKLACKAS